MSDIRRRRALHPLPPEPILRLNAEGRPLSSLGNRSYPKHLEYFEKHDLVFLELLADFGPATFRELAAMFYSESDLWDDLRPMSDCRQWSASATWRGLVGRNEKDIHLEYGSEVPRYFLTNRGCERLLQLRQS